MCCLIFLFKKVNKQNDSLNGTFLKLTIFLRSEDTLEIKSLPDKTVIPSVPSAETKKI